MTLSKMFSLGVFFAFAASLFQLSLQSVAVDSVKVLFDLHKEDREQRLPQPEYIISKSFSTRPGVALVPERLEQCKETCDVLKHAEESKKAFGSTEISNLPESYKTKFMRHVFPEDTTGATEFTCNELVANVNEDILFTPDMPKVCKMFGKKMEDLTYNVLKATFGSAAEQDVQDFIYLRNNCSLELSRITGQKIYFGKGLTVFMRILIYPETLPPGMTYITARLIEAAVDLMYLSALRGCVRSEKPIFGVERTTASRTTEVCVKKSDLEKHGILTTLLKAVDVNAVQTSSNTESIAGAKRKVAQWQVKVSDAASTYAAKLKELETAKTAKTTAETEKTAADNLTAGTEGKDTKVQLATTKLSDATTAETNAKKAADDAFTTLKTLTDELATHKTALAALEA